MAPILLRAQLPAVVPCRLTNLVPVHSAPSLFPGFSQHSLRAFAHAVPSASPVPPRWALCLPVSAERGLPSAPHVTGLFSPQPFYQQIYSTRLFISCPLFLCKCHAGRVSVCFVQCRIPPSL